MSDFFDTPPFLDALNPTTFWDTSYLYIHTASSAQGTQVFYELINSTGVVVFRLMNASNSPVVTASYWNGSSYTNIASTFNITNSVLHKLTVKLVCGVAGTVEVWLGAAQVVNHTHNDADVNNVAKVRRRGYVNNGAQPSYWSEMGGANFDLRGLRIRYDPPTGNSGTDTAWTGSYTDVDEAGVDDADYVTSATAAQREGFTHASYTIPGSYALDSVWIVGRPKTSGVAPTNVKYSLRIGGTPYDSSNVNPAASFQPVGAYWTDDPSTAAPWGNTNYNALEFGLLSVT